MFSDAPFSATPLASGAGPVYVLTSVDGVAGSAEVFSATYATVTVIEAGAAVVLGSSSVSWLGAVSETPAAVDSIDAQRMVLSEVAEGAGAADAPTMATTFVASTVDGAAGSAYYSTRVWFRLSAVESGAALDQTKMSQLWEFIGTGVNAGWQAVPTGTGSTWTLIKTRND